MKTTIRADYDATSQTFWNDAFQNESFRHENDIALKMVPGKTTKDIWFVDNANATAMIVDSVVKTRRGELQLNRLRGIPYFQSAFGVKGDLTDWAAYMQKGISETNGVQSLNGFTYGTSSTLGKRSLDYTATITTNWGEVTLTTDSVSKELSTPDTAYYPNETDSVSQFLVTIPQDGKYEFSIRCTIGVGSSSGKVYFGDGTRVILNENSEYIPTVGRNTMVRKIYTTAGNYVVSIDSGISHFAIGKNDADEASKVLVTRAYSWSNGVTSADGTYKSCVNLVGSIPSWGANISVARETYKGCLKIADATIPVWNSSMTDISDCYNGCIRIGTDFVITNEDTLVAFVNGINYIQEDFLQGYNLTPLDFNSSTMNNVVLRFNQIRQILLEVGVDVSSISNMSLNDALSVCITKFNSLYNLFK